MSVKLHASASNRLNSLPASDRGRIFSWLYDFAQNQKSWGNRLHRWAGSPGMWTSRIDDYFRAVLVQDGPDWFVVFVGKHPEADRWATGRKARVEDDQVILEFTSEGLEEIEKSSRAQAGPAEKPLIPRRVVSDATLTRWGLSARDITAIRVISDPNDLLEYATSLPEEVADRLLTVMDDPASAEEPTAQATPREEEAATVAGGLDIRRTYYIVDGNDDLLRVIDQPMASWIAFLHASQTRLAHGSFRGPVKVSGSAGTGKTVVALHRARHLAEQGKRVLVTTYADTLCANLSDQLDLLCTDEDQRELIEVSTVHDYAVGLLTSIGKTVKPDDEELTEKWLKELVDDMEDYARSPEWYVMEWEHVVHANDIRTLDEYLAVARAGRGSALRERDRRVVWKVFEKLFAKVKEAGITDGATVCRMAREALEDGSITCAPCDAVVVDEMQDLRPQELRFLAVLGGEEPDTLMVVGDMTQRVYVPRFTMRSAGVDVVGRSYRLRINYRTTGQIKELADNVVTGPSAQNRPDGAYSIYYGPRPGLCAFSTPEEESEYVAGAITRLLRNGSYEAHDIAVFARDAKRLDPVAALLDVEGIPTHRLSRQSPPDDHVRIGSMRRAKGLEFKAVFVIGVSSDAVPAPANVEYVFEPAARDEALERERQMLYVAMTRARDELTVTWAGEPSPFLPSFVTDAGVCGAEA